MIFKLSHRRIMQGLTLICVCILASCSKDNAPPYLPPPGVSWSSVLQEAADMNSLVAPVEDWERSLQFSSSAVTGKVTLANLAPEIFGDMDHGFFLKVEEHPEGVDATLAEMTGAGMITWIWSANPAGTIRLFIDDENKPILEMPFVDFVRGSFLPVKYPFSSLTANGFNMHFPILHKRFCRLVVRVPRKVDLSTLYYQVAWNALDPNERINTFSLADVARGGNLLKVIASRLNPAHEESVDFGSDWIQVLPGATQTVYAASSPGVITGIQFKGRSKSDLAALDFAAYWDGETTPAVECPLSMLAGVSGHMENMESFPVTVRNDVMEIRWPMPYLKARMELRNRSEKPMDLKYRFRTGPGETKLRFRGIYRSHYGLRTEAPNLLTLADVMGKGRLVGCVIQVYSDTKQWWGEGDQLIYLDSTQGPAWRGTGTEDYFGFAWCSTETFDHPFRGQSAVIRYGDARLSAMHRYHFLDRLPFHYFGQFQTEAWGLAPGKMDYDSLILCYVQQ